MNDPCEQGTIQLPHLLNLDKDVIDIATRQMDLFNTLYAYTEFQFPSVNARIWWVKEFGLN